MPIIHSKVKFVSIVYSNYQCSYHALDVSEFNRYRINQRKLFARKKVRGWRL